MQTRGPSSGHRAPPPRKTGRWHSLTASFLIIACAPVVGAESVNEIAEWATPGFGHRAAGRRFPLRWRRSPSQTTTGHVMALIDGGALNRASGPISDRPSHQRHTRNNGQLSVGCV
ncbi:transposase family protein [Streptomyces sp. NPDC048350]|uniref:transposase family protein n=1 Tax=Streptomyces sp. NPDC048350 TaxID=3365538 RepID=UPI00371B42C0